MHPLGEMLNPCASCSFVQAETHVSELLASVKRLLVWVHRSFFAPSHSTSIFQPNRLHPQPVHLAIPDSYLTRSS